MADETLADAAVRIVADFAEFEPELRRKLNQAVRAAATEAEKELKRSGSKSGKAFADGVNQAAKNASVLDGMRAQLGRLEDAAVKAGDAQADAAGKVRVAEAQLQKLRAKSNVQADQIVAAEERLAAARRRLASADNTARLATQALQKARTDLTATAQSIGGQVGDRFGDGLRRSLRRASGSAGDESGSFFADAFQTAAARALGSGLLKVFGGLTATLVTSVSPLATIFGGAAASIVAVAGAIGQASGAALAFGGVLGSLGLAAVAAQVGFSGLGDAVKAQSKALEEMAAEGKVSESTQKALDAALKNLAPNARAVVQQLAAMAPAWQKVRQSVQNNLFAGAAKSLQDLGARFLPILQTQLGTAATTLSQFATGFVRFLTAGPQASQINEILTSLNSILGKVLVGVKPLVSGFLTLFQASLPFAERLADVVGGLGDRFKAFADKVTGSGDFETFMEGAFQAASNLLGVLGNLGSIIGSVFSAGAANGNSLLGVLKELTGDLAAFLKSAEGQDALASFFGLIGAAGDALGGILDTLGPAVAGISAVFTALRPVLQQLGTALQPVILAFSELIGSTLTELAPILAQLLTGLTPLITALGTGLVTVLQAVLQAIIPILPVIVQFATTLAANIAPVVTALVPVLVQIVTALGQFLQAIIPILPALLPLIPPLAQISISLLQLVGAVTPLLTLFAQWAAVMTGQVVSGLNTVMPFIVALAEHMANVIGVATRVVSAIVGFVTRAVGLFLQFKQAGASTFGAFAATVATIIAGLVPRIVGFLTSMVSGGLRVLAGWAGSAAAAAGRVASGILGAIRSGLSGLAGAFAAPFNAARSAVAGAVERIVGVVSGAVDRIQGLVSRISGAIGKVRGLNFPGIDIPGFANGGLQRTPTLATIAEDGPEVVIPLTKPKRRDELLDKYFSGWDGGGSYNVNGGGGGRSTTYHTPVTIYAQSAEEVAAIMAVRFGLQPVRGIETAGGKL